MTRTLSDVNVSGGPRPESVAVVLYQGYMYGINMDLEPLGYSNWQVRTIIQLNVQVPTSETYRACEDK